MSGFSFISTNCRLFHGDGVSTQGSYSALTDAGATVNVDKPFEIPERVTLAIRRREVPCRVMWRSGGQVGLAFEHPGALM